MKQHFFFPKLIALCCAFLLLGSCGGSDDDKALKLIEEGNGFLDQKNYSSALMKFRSALNCELSAETKAKSYRNLAVIFLYLDQQDSAIFYSKKGMDCIGDDSYYHLINKAEYQLLDKQTVAAIKTFESAKKIRSGEMEVYNNLSLIYAGAYGEDFLDLKKSLLNAKKAFELKANPINQEQLASVYFQLENYSEAVKLFEDLSNKHPEEKLYGFYQGQCLYFMGQEEKGLELMENAAERDENCKKLFDEIVS